MTAPVRIIDILKVGVEREDLQGVVINPFDKPFTMRKNLLYHIVRDVEEIAGVKE